MSRSSRSNGKTPRVRCPTVRVGDKDGPGASVLAVVELIAQLTGRNESGSAHIRVALGIVEGDDSPVHEVVAVDEHRLAAA